AGRESRDGVGDLHVLGEAPRVGETHGVSDVEQETPADSERFLLFAVELGYHLVELDRHRRRANEHVALAADFESSPFRSRFLVGKIARDVLLRPFEERRELFGYPDGLEHVGSERIAPSVGCRPVVPRARHARDTFRVGARVWRTLSLLAI